MEVLAVSVDYKGQGLGSAMLNDCLIQSKGGTKMALVTNTEQNCRFYKKNNFNMFDKTVLEMNGTHVFNYCFIRNL